MLASPTGLNNVDIIFLDVLSVGRSHTDPTGCLGTRNYGKFATAGDLSADNLKAVPEPAIHALLDLGLGLAGIQLPAAQTRSTYRESLGSKSNSRRVRIITLILRRQYLGDTIRNSIDGFGLLIEEDANPARIGASYEIEGGNLFSGSS